MSQLHSVNVELDNRMVEGGLTRYSPDHLDESAICYKKCNIRCPNHEYLNNLMMTFLEEYSRPGKWEQTMRDRIVNEYPVSPLKIFKIIFI